MGRESAVVTRMGRDDGVPTAPDVGEHYSLSSKVGGGEVGGRAAGQVDAAAHRGEYRR